MSLDRSLDRRVLVLATGAAGVIHIAAAGAHHHGFGVVLLATGLVQLGFAWRAATSAAFRPEAVRCIAVCVLPAAAYVVDQSHLVSFHGEGHIHHTGLAALFGPLTLATAVVALMAGMRLITVSRRRLQAFTVPAASLAVMVLLSGSLVQAETSDQPGGCVTATRRMSLYAQQLPSSSDGKVRLGWGLSPKTASTPGPLIEMTEGECLAITVVNNVPADVLRSLYPSSWTGPIGVSLHVHGVKYTTSSDGTFGATSGIEDDSIVPPGQSRTYYWYAAPRVVSAGRVTSIGTAGAWWYHDHVVGTAHGTGGIDAGLVGGLVVRRAGDVEPDRSYTVFMGPGAKLNYASHDAFCPVPSSTSEASNSCFVAVEGERVEFVVITVGNDMHTFHLHGHNWADNRTGIPVAAGDETQLIDARILGPSESFGFQVVAGESVGPGSWMLHCHIQGHSDAGMATFFHVLPASGSLLSSAGETTTHDH